MKNSCFFCGIIGLIFNSILSITKVVIGLLTGSIGIMVDAINNIIDMSSSVLLLIGNKCQKNNSIYQHYRYNIFEYLTGLIISIVMIITSIIFVYNSISKIINPIELVFNKYTYLLILIAFLLKIIQYFLYKKINKKSNISSIDVIIIETKNDIITSISIITSIIIMNIFEINIDGYIGLIISIYVLIVSIKIFIKMNQLIIGNKISKDEENKIIKILSSYKKILKYNNLKIYSNNNYKYIIVNILFEDNNIKKYVNYLKRKYKKELNIDIYINLI